jgi:carboxylesterase type B
MDLLGLGSKLPVVIWIFGGRFEIGSNSGTNFTVLVETSVAQWKPILVVAVNYRVGGF